MDRLLWGDVVMIKRRLRYGQVLKTHGWKPVVFLVPRDGFASQHYENFKRFRPRHGGYAPGSDEHEQKKI